MRLANDLFIVKFENEKIISKFVGIIKCCAQSEDRVSKNDKSYHIWRIKSGIKINQILGVSGIQILAK